MNLFPALVLGVLSSIHCVGMCGPIALATPVVHKNFLTQMLSRILYNLGRAVSYMSIGLIAGFAGSIFFLGGFQQWISIITGIIILIWIIVPKANPENWKMIQNTKPVKWIRKSIGSLFRKKNYSSIFLIGLLNGLLPCGMVYMAVVGALSCSDSIQGSLYMLLFALGTMPLMFILTSAWELLNGNFKKYSRKLLPYGVALVGIMLILRGAGLGVPYLSPSLKTNEHSITSCK